MEEKWKLIPGSTVEVSNLGNARSHKTKKLRKILRGSNGDPRITYNSNSGTLDKLIAELFLGMKPGQRVEHIDGDRFNCRVDNLKVVDKPAKYAKQKYIYKVTSYGTKPRYYDKISDCSQAELGKNNHMPFAALKKRLNDHDIFVERIQADEAVRLYHSSSKEERQQHNYTIHNFLDYVVDKYGTEWFIGWDIPEMCKKDEYVKEYYDFVKNLA